MKSRISCIAAIITVLLLCASTASFAADPKETHYRFDLNNAAYKGITFEMMYGNIANSVNGITMGEFFAKLTDKAKQEAQSTDPDYAKLCATVVTDLGELTTLLEATVSGAPKLKDWPLRALFDSKLDSDEMKKVMVTVASGDVPAVGELRTHLTALEADGLTVPCNRVYSLDSYGLFNKLVACESFWALMGPQDYPFFFSTPIDAVENDLIEVTQQAVEVGLFGMFEFYKSASDEDVRNVIKEAKAESKAQIAAALLAKVKATNYCCNQITKKCQPDAYATHVCVTCGTTCCLGSTKCPL